MNDASTRDGKIRERQQVVSSTGEILGSASTGLRAGHRF